MQKQLIIILFLGLSSLMLSSCSSSGDASPDISTALPKTATSTSTELSNTPTPIPTDFTARFEIFTNGTKRIFTDVKYHNQSSDVYIESLDPNLIYVKKSGATWSDFFSTLPFSLKKDCLITGTKQTFCNSETKRLYFYLNGQEIPDALDRVIAPNDSLRVEYSSITSS